MKFIDKTEQIDTAIVSEIKNNAKVSDVLAKVFAARGCSSSADVIKRYIDFNKDVFIDPFLFRDMKKAVDAIYQVKNEGGTVVIFGDYDVDGTMATSIMLLGLYEIGVNLKCFVPNRMTDGYGLSEHLIDVIQEKYNPSLIITVDCGITAKDAVAYAYSKGIKVIVSDHHEPPQELPVCEAILDAKVEGETYPFKELCGAGVASKIVWAACGYEVFRKYLDLVALATVADLVPLNGENHALVKAGLMWLNRMPMRMGMKIMSDYIKKGNEPVTTYMFGYKYGPMINACGRLGDAKIAIATMVNRLEYQVQNAVKQMHMLNEKRKEIEHNTIEECFKLLKNDERVLKKSIVLWGANWHSGVIGIAASKIQERHNCPVVLLAYDKDKKQYHGSCRSIDGVDIYALLCECKDTIVQFGGHKMAAGLTVAEDRINDFKQAFENAVNKIPDETFERVYYHDGVVAVKDINENLIHSIKYLEPCGVGNPAAKFLLKNVSLKDIVMCGKKLDSFRCTLYDETGSVQAIAFNSTRPDEFAEYDMIISPKTNSFRGKAIIQCNILAMHKSANSKNTAALSEETVYGTRIVDQSIDVLGLAPKKQKQFNDAGIFTLGDLIDYVPKKYNDFRYDKTVSEVTDKEVCCIIGDITKKHFGEKMIRADCVDKTGRRFMACWFNQPYVYQPLIEGKTYIFCGQVRIMDNGFVQIIPTEWDYHLENLQKMVPVYKKIKGMSNAYLIDSIKAAMKATANTDYLEKVVCSKFGLVSKYDCMFKLHFPNNDMDVRNAKRRMIFDNLFRFNFILKDRMKDGDFNTAFPVKSNRIWDSIRKLLPYDLTPDQNETLNGMYSRMQTGERLNALVQGDVGTGKTIVAFMMMAMAFENCFQSCIIAPTEVLAQQHYNGLLEITDKLGIKIGYLTGSTKAREKKAIREGLADGSIRMVVGTHAVLQDSVEFNKLGLVIIDEQHRFGVAQRDKLLDNENKPHMITMSATPIPRTLSMALYGDHIQVYNIKTKPAGRKDVITMQMESDNDINNFMLKEIRAGHQCYVVCPLIEDSESEAMAEVTSVNQTVEAITNWFKPYSEVKISNVTGKMKPKEVAEEIEKFVNNETNILISTTIIEVGVNVPNATVMVIKSSERFGLAQAHQLRGRVGRGNDQSYCLLQPAPDDPKADILCSTTDGFEIANQDMLLRGAGDYIGTSQTGSNKDVMLMMAEPDLYREIGYLNDEIFADPARFAKYSYLIDEYNASK